LVGLDVTHQTVFARETWEMIDGSTTRAAALVHSVMARTFTERQMTGFYLHDPLAVAIAVDPSLVRGIGHEASVVTEKESRGKTIVGEMRSGSLIATQVDAERFVQKLAESLGLPVTAATLGFARPE
jgi:purine nucleosidase